MEQVFIDTDVIIDFFIDRKPFSEKAAEIFSYSELGKIKGYVSSLSFSNVFYIVRKLEGRKKAIGSLEQLEKIITILPVDGRIVRQALISEIQDFEDALQNYCALSGGVKAIVTRNIKDYSKSSLAIHTPESYLKIIRRKLKKE